MSHEADSDGNVDSCKTVPVEDLDADPDFGPTSPPANSLVLRRTGSLDGLNDDIALRQFLQPAEAPIEDHGRLTPLGSRSERAFHDVAEALYTRPRWNRNARKFMHINWNPRMSTFTGYWRFNLTILPKNFVLGVVIGQSHTEADMIITMNPEDDDVTGRHARVFHHPESHILRIHAFPTKIVYLNGAEVDDNGTTLSGTMMALQIGNLSYRFEFLAHDSGIYNEVLRDLILESTAQSWLDHRYFDPTPQRDHFVIRGYQMQSALASGSEGVVFPCVHVSTSQVYAAKRITRTKSSLERFRNESKIYEVLGDHNRICSLVATLFAGGSEASMGDRSANDMYHILKPYAPQTLVNLIATGQGKQYATKAAYQLVEGLRHIHSHSCVHRDIKPGNILIENLLPFQLRITDFGRATMDANSQDHKAGTTEYYAPEIRNLKQWHEEQLQLPVAKRSTKIPRTWYWSRESDIFSYGVVIFELIHGWVTRTQGVIDEKTREYLVAEAIASSTALGELISDMLAEDPQQRPSAEAILRKPFWPDPVTVLEKRKRP